MAQFAAGWSTTFDRGLFSPLRYRRLRFAYRAPTFFLQAITAAGIDVSYVGIDECLTAGSISSGRRELPWILWVTTHGEFTQRGFQFDLHSKDVGLHEVDWQGSGPSVLILDTCDCVDLGEPNWERRWLSTIEPSLRLVLGFSSPATICEPTSLRGRSFADRILRGDKLVDAWLSAATNDTYPGLDRAVAIAFGSTSEEAELILDTASLSNLPTAANSNRAAWLGG
jgi:hypothetical protein